MSNSCISNVMWSALLDTSIELFIPWLVGVVVIMAFSSIPYQYFGKHPEIGHHVLILSFVMLGAVIGLLSGTSRTPVIGALIPALLTFISATLAYIFSKDTLASLRPVIPLCMIGMLSASVFFTFIGTTLRGSYEQDLLEFARHNLLLDEMSKKHIETLKQAIKDGDPIELIPSEC